MRYERVLLEHGGGGLLMNELITHTILPKFKNVYLDRLEDSAVFDIGNIKLCFTTDSYVVDPIFFPGGNIGSLAIHGTVNDISVCGGVPLYLSAGFILEEGLSMDDLEKIIESMAEAAAKAITASTCSSVSAGKSLRISPTRAPSAKLARIVRIVTRVPAITGSPPQTRGSRRINLS